MSVFFYRSISFGLDTATNTAHHPEAEAKTVEFAHLSLCHLLLPFVDSSSLLHKKNPCRSGLTTYVAYVQVMAPDLPLWAPLRSRWDRNRPEIYEHKVSVFRHRNTSHFHAWKDSSYSWVYARPYTWYSTRRCTCQTTWTTLVHIFLKENFLFFSDFSHLFVASRQLCSARMTVIPHPKANLWNRISQLFAREIWLINKFFFKMILAAAAHC